MQELSNAELVARIEEQAKHLTDMWREAERREWLEGTEGLFIRLSINDGKSVHVTAFEGRRLTKF